MLVDHRHEAAKAFRIDSGQLVAPEESVSVVPFVHHMDQLDSMVFQSLQFLLIVFSGFPRFAAGILAHIVDTLGRQIVRHEVLAHALADSLRAQADVREPPPVVVGGVAFQNRRRGGVSGGDSSRG